MGSVSLKEICLGIDNRRSSFPEVTAKCMGRCDRQRAGQQEDQDPHQELLVAALVGVGTEFGLVCSKITDALS